MSNIQFKLTGGSRIPAGLPARMDIMVALEATEHCDGRPVIDGMESTNLFVTFIGAEVEDDPYTGYGRVIIGPGNTAKITPQFEEDIKDQSVRNLKAGDTFTWRCGCESIVKNLDELAPAFDVEYDVRVTPDPRQQMGGMLGLMAVAKMLGIDATGIMGDVDNLLAD